jgi:regulator of Ty1 transposition protein 109
LESLQVVGDHKLFGASLLLASSICSYPVCNNISLSANSNPRAADHDKNILLCYLIMAAHERLATQVSVVSPTFFQKLATVLPTGARFKTFHLSTPPTRTSAIYSAPPGARPDRTYCENHYLAVSIAIDVEKEPQEVLVFAVEVLIYSTAYDTTFFVSKADSTGYLHLLGLLKGTPSPIRDITSTFLRHLVDERHRSNTRSIISLFARAQDQYLFPGSVEYSGKHVLDDRGLVRWWCRVLDPLIDEPTSTGWESVKGYLVVPGLDTREMSSCIPKRSGAHNSWTVGHPLLELSRHLGEVPPRCLIPHFPDDPKARYLDELDEEITRGKNNSNGQWKSVKSIDQFWEMMEFRQECSAGRMVGFIWVVFTPGIQPQPSEVPVRDGHSPLHASDISTIATVKEEAVSASHQSARPKTKASSKKKKLTGLIIPRQPRVKTENRNYLLERPEATAYYLWRPGGRGQIVVDDADYKRVTELLLRLDFANLELAASSSTRWINEVRSGAQGAMRDAWGEVVIGTKPVDIRTQATVSGAQTLNVGLVRKKRKPGVVELQEAVPETTKINVLTTGMIRKKPKAG